MPDDLFERAKKVCEAQGVSLTELARRGLENIISAYAAEPRGAEPWSPPKPCRLGWKGLSDREIKEQAQRTATESSLTGAPGG